MADAVYLFLANPPGDGLEDDSGGVPEEYNEFAIIREMGWDWWTYRRQPAFFIGQVRQFMIAERKAAEKRSRKDARK